jgi:hypothetical protein
VGNGHTSAATVVDAYSSAAGSMMRSHLTCARDGPVRGCVVRRWWRPLLEMAAVSQPVLRRRSGA